MKTKICLVAGRIAARFLSYRTYGYISYRYEKRATIPKRLLKPIAYI